MTITIAALYRFVPVTDVPAVCSDLKARFAALDIRGTLLVAPEGVNGTLAGSAEGITAMLDLLEERYAISKGEVKFSHAEFQPFQRLKVRPKKEIITFRQPEADPTKQVGQYLDPAGWNKLLEDPEVLLLDTRNLYETEIGTFAGAVVPPIDKFTEFADFVREQLAAAKARKIAMFCTGGIRCEKASAFMLAEGFPEVYHLKGGILKYLEEVPAEVSKWQGECYVFDERGAVGQGLRPSSAASDLVIPAKAGIQF